MRPAVVFDRWIGVTMAQPTEPRADDLSTVLRVLHQVVERDQECVRRSEQHCSTQLLAHAVFALVTAPLFMASSNLFTSEPWAILGLIPGFPLSMAVLLLTGGLVLVSAALTRKPILAIVGLSFLFGWHLIMAFGFAIPYWHWLFDIIHSWNHRDVTMFAAPRYYIWATYSHLAVIMLIHMRVLIGKYRAMRVAILRRPDSTVTT